MQGKNFRRKIAAGFNFWYAVNSADMDWIFRFIDLLHNGSLVIDDIQDHSQLRRGKPAAHILYGVPLSINAANYAYFDALKVVLEKSCLGVRILKIMECMVAPNQHCIYWLNHTL